jgi:hypothetical protein
MRKQNNCERALLPAPIAIFAFLRRSHYLRSRSVVLIAASDPAEDHRMRRLYRQAPTSARGNRQIFSSVASPHTISVNAPQHPASLHRCSQVALLTTSPCSKLAIVAADTVGTNGSRNKSPDVSADPSRFHNLRFSFTGVLSRRSRCMKLPPNRFDEPKNGMLNNHSALITYASNGWFENDEKNR